MAFEAAEALGLALLGAAEDREQLVHRFAWHDLAQEHDRRAHGVDVDVEVGTGEAEQRRHRIFRLDHCVDHDAAARALQRNHERRRMRPARGLADQVGARVAVEDRRQHVDADQRVAAQLARVVLADLHREVVRAATAVRVADAPRVVGEQVREHALERSVGVIVLADQRAGDVAKRDRLLARELDRVVDARRQEQPSRHRAEVGLRELDVGIRRDEFGEDRLRAHPHSSICRARTEHGLRMKHRAGYVLVVEVDAFRGVALHALPVAALEPPLRALRDRAELVVVGEEGVADRRGNAGGELLVVGLLRPGDVRVLGHESLHRHRHRSVRSGSRPRIGGFGRAADGLDAILACGRLPPIRHRAQSATAQAGEHRTRRLHRRCRERGRRSL